MDSDDGEAPREYADRSLGKPRESFGTITKEDPTQEIRKDPTVQVEPFEFDTTLIKDDIYD